MAAKEKQLLYGAGVKMQQLINSNIDAFEHHLTTTGRG